jgi:hypothetical protein
VVFFVFLLDFGTVPTVWYFSIRFWYCSNSVDRQIPHCWNSTKI